MRLLSLHAQNEIWEQVLLNNIFPKKKTLKSHRFYKFCSYLYERRFINAVKNFKFLLTSFRNKKKLQRKQS